MFLSSLCPLIDALLCDLIDEKKSYLIAAVFDSNYMKAISLNRVKSPDTMLKYQYSSPYIYAKGSFIWSKDWLMMSRVVQIATNFCFHRTGVTSLDWLKKKSTYKKHELG